MKRYRALLFVLALAFCAGCDQTTKKLAEQTLSGSPAISVAGDVLRFELARNPGAFMSLGADWTAELRGLLFVVIAPMGMLILCTWALWTGFASRLSLLGLAMIAGGALGNWIDRVSQDGAVTDFVSLGVGSFRTGIFNLADAFIIVGAAMVLLWQHHGEAGAAD